MPVARDTLPLPAALTRAQARRNALLLALAYVGSLGLITLAQSTLQPTLRTMVAQATYQQTKVTAQSR